MTVHPGSISIVSNNYSLGTNFDIIFVIVSLKMDTCSLTFESMSADSQSNKSTALFIWSEFAWEKCHTALSEVGGWKTFKSNFAKIIWWWQWGWREACTPESITILGWDVNKKSTQDHEFSKIGVGSVIICDKPNFEVRSWIWEPSKLVLSILHHC